MDRIIYFTTMKCGAEVPHLHNNWIEYIFFLLSVSFCFLWRVYRFELCAYTSQQTTLNRRLSPIRYVDMYPPVDLSPNRLIFMWYIHKLTSQHSCRLSVKNPIAFTFTLTFAMAFESRTHTGIPILNMFSMPFGFIWPAITNDMYFVV